MAIVPYEFEFCVTEAEYPKLQAACPGEFPLPYKQFITAINKRIEKRLQQAPSRKAYVDVSEFLAFCVKRGIAPDHQARTTYVFFVGNKQIPT